MCIFHVISESKICFDAEKWIMACIYVLILLSILNIFGIMASLIVLLC